MKLMKSIATAIILSVILMTFVLASPAPAQEAPEGYTAEFVREMFPPVTIYENVTDSLVSIESVSLPFAGVSMLSPFQRTISRVGGTGFIITSDGYIITYPQTVEEAEIVNVTIEGEVYKASVESKDEYYQVALLKVWWPEPNEPGYEDYPEKREFKPVVWGDSDSVERGDPVIVMGDPVDLENTMTYGFCSNIRDMRMVGPNGWDGILIIDAIVIDASINPGNFGGPVFNDEGEVIGIVNRKTTGGVQNINYALPSNKMLDVANQLIEDGKVFHPWFGVFPYARYDKVLAVYMGIPIDEINPDTGEPYELVGVMVDGVAATSPAAQIGLQRGDLLLRIDGELLETVKDLEEAIMQMEPAQRFSVTVIRNNEVYNKQCRIADKEVWYANISWWISI
jgi:serine protease Do